MSRAAIETVKKMHALTQTRPEELIKVFEGAKWSPEEL